MFDKAWAEEHQDMDLLMYCDHAVKIEDHYIYDFENEYMDCTIKVNGSVTDQFRFPLVFYRMYWKCSRESGVHFGKT